MNLSELEIKKFEKAPEFENNIERNYYFTLPSSIHKQALTFGNDQSFIFFTLIFGYFKATNMFFELNSFSSIDTKFISDKYQLCTFDSKTIFASRTAQRYKQLIKAHLGVNEYSNDIELKLQNHAIELANNFTHRKKIFFSLVDYSKKLNIEIPSYTNLSKIIQKTKFWDKHRSKALNERQIKVLNKMLDMGNENFEGELNTKKYISLTKVSKATAVRDITALVEFGCIKKIDGTAGRNIRYEIKF